MTGGRDLPPEAGIQAPTAASGGATNFVRRPRSGVKRKLM
jgi:hypothetical protein